MPLVVVALAIAAIALYLWLCYLAIVYVVVPLLPYTVVAGVLLGTLLTVVVLVGTWAGVARFRPVTVTPADVATRLPARKGTAFPRDDAWPNYLFAQSRTDLATASAWVYRAVARIWAGSVSALRKNPTALYFWPLLLPPLVFVGVLTGAVVGAGLALGVVVGAVLLAALLGWLVVSLILRGVDLGVRRLRGAKATCHYPGCNERSMLPAFRCACGEVHHDIRAGRQGAFFRRCGCGRLLTTTVLRAASGMVAVCQRCSRPLHAGSAVLTDVVVPVFGPANAGKTRFVYAGMVALARHLAAAGGSLQPVGSDNGATFADATAVVEDARPTVKTNEGAPAAITVRVGTGNREALLHLYDAAGESFGDRRKAAELTYLADTQGLVFVLDPFSIPGVVSELRADRSALDDAHPAQLDPEQSYLITAQWLGDQQVPLNRMPLVIAVVKADLLVKLHPGTGLGPDSTSEDIESWLRAKHVDNLVEGAKRDFREVRFFLVSSLDDISAPDGRASPTSPARPLMWLLERSGMTVAQEKESVPS